MQCVGSGSWRCVRPAVGGASPLKGSPCRADHALGPGERLAAVRTLQRLTGPPAAGSGPGPATRALSQACEPPKSPQGMLCACPWYTPAPQPACRPSLALDPGGQRLQAIRFAANVRAPLRREVRMPCLACNPPPAKLGGGSKPIRRTVGRLQSGVTASCAGFSPALGLGVTRAAQDPPSVSAVPFSRAGSFGSRGSLADLAGPRFPRNLRARGCRALQGFGSSGARRRVLGARLRRANCGLEG